MQTICQHKALITHRNVGGKMPKPISQLITAWLAAFLAITPLRSTPNEADARLIIFRVHGPAFTVPCVIKFAGKDVGFVGNKRYLELVVPKGTYQVSATDSFGSKETALAVLEIELAAEQPKFIQCKRAPGLSPFGNFQISMSNEATFENFKPKLKLQDQSRMKRDGS